jgi:hypothetical protein
MIALPVKSLGLIVAGCLCMAVWHKLKTEESETTGKNTADTETYSAPNRARSAEASNDDAREMRLRALRESRSSHDLRSAGRATPSATAGSPSSPFSGQGETARPPRVAIAAALLQNLEPDQLAALSAYEQAVIAELGEYALEAAAAQPTHGDAVPGAAPDPRIVDATDAPIPADQSEHPVDAAALADSYLRATLGHDRYNQLSILAAVRAYEARRAAVGSGSR